MEVNEDEASGEVNIAEGRSTSSNIGANEIDEETVTKLRGDAIGDTMYSEVFVLNTLLQFSDLKWSAEVEENLCFLWDMTEEKDVCQYLFQVSYPSLACSAITNYNEPRFVEIVVGIFANLLCSKCEKTVKEEEINVVLDLLNSNDPYILIQVMRFVHAVSFMFEKLSFITDQHLDRINFILYSSTNKELLGLSLKVLSAITDETKLNENVIKGELLKSAVIAYKGIKVEVDSESEVELFDSQEEHVVAKHLIQFVCNICSYIDSLKITRLLSEINEIIDEFNNEMYILLTYFTVARNLSPVYEEFKFYTEALTYIYRILCVPYISTIFTTLCKIMLILVEKEASFECINELFCYFISVGNVDCLKRDLKRFPIAEIKNVLSIVEDRANNFEFYYLDNLRQVINAL